jgi:hypothetical protein
MKRIDMTKLLLLPTFLLLFLGFCEKENKIRKYQEKIPQAEKTPSQGQERSSNRVSRFTWKVPQGWTQEASKSRMRLATLSTKNKEEKGTCTIIRLQGDAGGLKPNVLRWLYQLNLQPNSHNQVDDFIAKQKRILTAGNLKALFLDFTTFPAASAESSMFVTVVDLKDSTLFIKMTGKISILQENRDKFISLSQSLDKAR